MVPEDAYPFVLCALCVWREARGQTPAAKLGVAWTIKNRVNHPSWWGTDWVGVILKPEQYSSFNHNDPNATKLPQENDTSWIAALQAAEAVWDSNSVDPTGGATHYYDNSMDANPPSWAAAMTHVCDIDNLHFYK